MRRSPVSLTLAALLLVLAHAPAARAQQEPDLLQQKAVLELPGMSAVQVDTGIVFSTVAGHPLKFDLFHPTTASSKKAPLVIFVNGVGIDDPASPLGHLPELGTSGRGQRHGGRDP